LSKTQSSESARLIGPVRALNDGYGFVDIENHDRISLGRQDMRRVFPNDIVEVRVGSTDRKGRLQGRIVDILERNTRELVGRFNDEHGLCYVKPNNSRISHDIQIPKKHTAGAKSGQIVVAEITEQPGEFAPAIGRITEILGEELSAGMEIQVALREFGIPHEWPESVEDEADALGATVKSAHKKNRVDLRKLPFVTIDGEDARDFDDAVFVERDGLGWKLWVAIADVSHYVKPGSALDQEAQQRATSVYFPDYVVPMLPEVLSNGLCSLNPNVDRLALVSEIKIDSKGNLVDFRYSEAVIRSHERLTYTRVANALEERNQAQTPERDSLGPLCQQIDELHALYKVLFRARQKRGAMEFESVEVRFEFNADRKIEKIVPMVRNDAHKLIEECMLCANICAAQFLIRNKIPGLFRVHLPPANEKLEALRNYLSEAGLWLGGGEQPTTSDFYKLSEAMGDRADKHLIQMQILRSQQQAVYQPENKGHFGLAYEAYAHSTSPIRRYPDLLVHRAIRSVIRSGKKAFHVRRVEGAPALPAKKSYPYDLESLEALGQTCSAYERRAEDATRDVAQWLKCEYLQKHVGDRFMGVISTVTQFGIFVELADLYIEGLVHITNLPNDYYEYDSANQILIGESTRRTFKIGDKAMVQVARVDLDERKIDFELTNSSGNSDPKGNNVQESGSGYSGRKSRALSNRTLESSLSDGAKSNKKRGPRKDKKTRKASMKKSGARQSRKSRRGK
jgi:ribonuclease R